MVDFVVGVEVFLSIIQNHQHPTLRRLTDGVEPMAHSNSGFSEASDLLAAALEQMDGILASNYQVILIRLLNHH